MLPDKMRAVVAPEPGDADKLVLTEIEVPQPGAREVLIRVAGAALNRGDIVQRQGFYPPPPGAPDTLGLEASGEVVAVGSQVSDIQIGESVCVLVAGGGYAEYCLAPVETCLPFPAGTTAIEAASLPEIYMTVWSNVYDRARLKSGESFLVHGGSSGIGTAAIQLAKARGSTVIATAGSDEKCQVCTDLGADLAVNYNTTDFVEAVKDFTGSGVNVILDMVGGDYYERNIKALAVEGRLVNIGFQNGAIIEANLMLVMLNRLTLTGSTLRARELEFKGRIAQEVKQEVWPLFETGALKPIVDSTFPLSEAAAAHRHMESSTHIGKIVLTMDD